jgi:hypothetical protein
MGITGLCGRVAICEMVLLLIVCSSSSMNVGPCHHGMARPQMRMEKRPPIWRVAVNKLNKQPRTADSEWSVASGVGRGANNSFP